MTFNDQTDLLEDIGSCADDIEIWSQRVRQIPLERAALDTELLTLERDIALRTARKFELMLYLAKVGGAK